MLLGLTLRLEKTQIASSKSSHFGERGDVSPTGDFCSILVTTVYSIT